jgi:hypothetical protein
MRLLSLTAFSFFPPQVPLDLTLEELYSGCTKRRRVTRSIVDGASGRALPVEETLEIPVRAGWKEGTKITFEGGPSAAHAVGSCCRGCCCVAPAAVVTAARVQRTSAPP